MTLPRTASNIYSLYYELEPKPTITFKQTKEESLCLCDFYYVIIVWLLLAHLLLVEPAKTVQGVPHSNGVA